MRVVADSLGLAVLDSSEHCFPAPQDGIHLDAENNKKLKELGFRVLRFWESEIRAHPEAIAERVAVVINARSTPPAEVLKLS